MNGKVPNKVDIVYATEHEEFFYKDSDIVVGEGMPIGVDVDQGDLVHLVLFEDIYWNPTDE
jgi:hypothetical protein